MSSVTTAAGAPPREPIHYWEARAQRFAAEGDGLRAVCSYGMPGLYNRTIEVSQRRALRPWLESVGPGSHALDLGCGIGRWSRALARRGVEVVGVDLSDAMVAEAARRAEAEGLGSHCRFRQGDLAELDLGHRFDLVVCVTVIQHILDPERRRRALRRVAEHLAPGGRVVLLEAAPSQPWGRSDHPWFRAHTAAEYERMFGDAGLALAHVEGVDLAPVRKYLLPLHARLPRWLGVPALALGAALTLPPELVLARRFPRASWHKLFVLTHRRR